MSGLIEMLGFMDESGDVGMKLITGSSRFFTLALVLFRDLRVAQSCDRRINAIRKELRLLPEAEFHFTHASTDVRTAFLKFVANYDFRYVACTLDKSRLAGKAWHRKSYFCLRAAQLILEVARPLLLNAKVVIDASTDRTFDQEFAKYLKRHAGKTNGQPLIREATTEKSHKHNLLQLADMVCGAVARTYRQERKDRTIYRQLIEKREESIRLWPE
jgi:hypothetical protein